MFHSRSVMYIVHANTRGPVIHGRELLFKPRARRNKELIVLWISRPCRQQCPASMHLTLCIQDGGFSL